MALQFPDINPVAIKLGPLSIRWYALAYLSGFILGWIYARALAKRQSYRPNPVDIDDLLTWVVLGVILGGRIGYVLVYNLQEYIAHPLDIVRVWGGGMSFHGGLVGVITALLLFARARKIPVLAVADTVCPVVPIGLLFGRIANFVNGELWGRPSDVPWAVIFPGTAAGGVPRHPSQLYQAGMEGLLLLLLMSLFAFFPRLRARTGLASGTFLAGYAIARLIGELFRQPDAQMSFMPSWITMGQTLSIPMLLAGLWLIVRALRNPSLRSDVPAVA